MQEHLHEVRTTHLTKVAGLADGCRVVYINLGDVTNGKKYPEQLVTTRLSDQSEIAAWNMRPVMDGLNVAVARFMVGTSAHNAGEASLDIDAVAKIRLFYPELDIAVHEHGLYTVDSVEFDCAHHGPGPGIRDWTRGNVARLYLKDRMVQDLKRGVVPAKAYLRGHHHQLVIVRHDELWGDRLYSAMLIIVPGDCGMSEHARQTSQSQHLQRHGRVAFEIVDGSLMNEVLLLWETLDLRTRDML